MRLHCLLIFVGAAVPALSQLTDCYWPNGNNATSLFVCSPDAENSHCCRKGDVCLTNGLCFSPGLGTVLRRGCTDSTFKASPCTDICGTINRFSGSDAALTWCGSYGSFCCGDNKPARDCCDGVGNETLAVTVTSGEFINPPPNEDEEDGGESTAPSPTSTQNSPPRTNDTCPTNFAQDKQDSPSDGSLKTARNALAGVTAALGVAAIAAAALAFRWKRKLDRMTEVATRLNGIVPPGYRDPGLAAPGAGNGQHILMGPVGK